MNSRKRSGSGSNVRPALIALALFGPMWMPVGARGDERNWTGKIILLKKTGIRISRTNGRGEHVHVATLTSASYRVLADEGGRLKVSHGEEGWFDKADAVLLADAAAYFTSRLRADPNDGLAVLMRGVANAMQGELDAALKDFDEAIRLDPTFTMAFNNRGVTWKRKKEYSKAVKDFDEVIRLDPKGYLAYYNKACCFAVQGKAELAVENLRRSLELGYKNYRHLETDADFNPIRDDAHFKDLMKKYVK